MKENQIVEVSEVRQPSQRKRHRLMSMLLAVMMVVSLAVPCFAAETSGQVDVNTVLESTDTITTMIAKVFSLITSNWYLTLFLGMSLLGLGIGGFKKLKRAT